MQNEKRKQQTIELPNDFIKVDKYQSQRMYSEKEVKHIVLEALQSALVKVDFEQWFKQFSNLKQNK